MVRKRLAENLAEAMNRTTWRRYVKWRQSMGHRHRRIAELQCSSSSWKDQLGYVAEGQHPSAVNTTQTLIMCWSSYSIIMLGRALTLLCQLMQLFATWEEMWLMNCVCWQHTWFKVKQPATEQRVLVQHHDFQESRAESSGFSGSSTRLDSLRGMPAAGISAVAETTTPRGYNKRC
jgi:hypothetical protein